MQLMTCLEKAIQLLRELVQAKRYPVLPGGFKVFGCNGIALNLQKFWIKRIVRLLKERYSLPHFEDLDFVSCD